jgi:hypothetical protein
MKRIDISLFILLFSLSVFAQNPPLLHLKYEQNYTPTYSEVVEMYQLLDSKYENAKLVKNGLTDCGKPLHTIPLPKNSVEFLS